MKQVLFAILVITCLSSPSFADQKPSPQPSLQPSGSSNLNNGTPSPAQPMPPTYLLPSPQLLDAVERSIEKTLTKPQPVQEGGNRPTEWELFGITASSWLAIATIVLAVATSVYAFATAALAYVTNEASKRATKAAVDATAAQVQASGENVKRQVQASAENVERQVAASSEEVNKQVAASKDAATIQARASSISNNRQQWINSLRDEVTGFLTDADLLYVVQEEMPIGEERNQQFLRIARALRSHIFKVRLLINPTEGESLQLVEMLTRVMNVGCLSDEAREQIVSHTQGILKTEWERVKSGA